VKLNPLTPFPTKEGGKIKASLLAGERYPAGSKLWRGVFQIP